MVLVRLVAFSVALLLEVVEFCHVVSLRRDGTLGTCWDPWDRFLPSHVSRSAGFLAPFPDFLGRQSVKGVTFHTGHMVSAQTLVSSHSELWTPCP